MKKLLFWAHCGGALVFFHIDFHNFINVKFYKECYNAMMYDLSNWERNICKTEKIVA